MKNILVIEPSSAGLGILPVAKSMGLGVFVFSANKDERVIPSDHYNYIDKLIEINTYDITALYNFAKKINRTHLLSAIIPGSEYHVPITSQLSAMMGLPGISPDHVDNLRLKNKTRDCLEKKSIRCPQYAVITTEEEISTASNTVGFPCVIKPVASAGSIHVSRINSSNELLQAYRAMCSDTWTELEKSIGSVAIIEEYIDGEEFSVEGYIENSQARFISITETFLTPEPLFVKIGHIIPANINTEKQKIIKSYIQEVITALNINLGIFHAELRIDQQGPILLEIAGRLPGGRICDLIQLANGINFYQIIIQAHLGQSIKIDRQLIQQYAGIHYFELNGKEKFSHVNGLERLYDIPGFVEFKLLKKPGEYVQPLKDFTSLVATSIFIAPTYEEINLRLDSARSSITFS